jgi:S-formylglutathione hydrolase FrmB
MDGRPEDWIDKGHLLEVLQSHRLVGVMPDGADSYYTNAVLRPKDRYEDFIVRDLLADVEQHYRVLPKPAARGIAGISMGGFGAVKIALRHPDQYSFAAGLSAPLDAPRWPFSLKRLGQSFRILRIFGPSGTSSRRANDVFELVKQQRPEPYLVLACGTGESLLTVNRAFDALLVKRNIPHEYHESAGGHSWDHWQREMPELLNAAEKYLKAAE